MSASIVESQAEWKRRGRPARGWLAPSVEVHLARSEFGTHHHGAVGVPGAGAAWDAPLRSLRDRAHPLLTLATAELTILDDLDTPEDLRALQKRLDRGPRAL